MKFLHLTISILFLVFAILQWNDPDAFKWIVMYSVVSVIALLALRGMHFLWLNALVGGFLIVSLAFYIPHVTAWFNDGRPNIADSMHASSPYIELVREFFGLFISLISVIFYLVISKNKRS